MQARPMKPGTLKVILAAICGALLLTAVFRLLAPIDSGGMIVRKETGKAGKWIYDSDMKQINHSSGRWILNVSMQSGTDITVTGVAKTPATFSSLSLEDSVSDGLRIIAIGNEAFSYCGRLASVTIPDSVTSIGEKAFASCYYLASVVIPDSVTNIGRAAFSRCASLTSMTASSGVTSISEWSFAECIGLTSVTISPGVTKIGDKAFAYCTSLTNVTILASKTRIGDASFDGCVRLTNVTIPDSVTRIGRDAFPSRIRFIRPEAKAD